MYERWKAKGLVVVGIHHPKIRSAFDADYVRKVAAQYGFRFPVAQDAEWQTIKAYGVGITFKEFTSVSFLVDREGITRFIHDGGEFHRSDDPQHAACNEAFSALGEAVEKLLAP